MTDTVTPDHRLQIGMEFWASKTLLGAVELGVFTELVREPADLAALSRRLGVHDDHSVRDLLGCLADSRSPAIAEVVPPSPQKMLNSRARLD